MNWRRIGISDGEFDFRQVVKIRIEDAATMFTVSMPALMKFFFVSSSAAWNVGTIFVDIVILCGRLGGFV